MKVDEIIKAVLQLIDNSEQTQPNDEPVGYVEDDLDRFKQIAGILPTSQPELANTPAEEYADIDSVTVNAGGGVNGPKHPADIRGDHPSMYPASQWRGE
jgi:hypothetical protein